MIEVTDLVKSYGDFTAVQGISFTAQPGQVTGFLGPNGAGKTTTMRILTGFMPPTSGTAIVAGHNVFEDSLSVRNRVGYLPENVPLYRDMSAIGYLSYVAEIRGVKQRRSRAQDALRRVGLSDRANSLVRTLSKGMKQRVGLAAALLHDPEVLILDEPTIGLDPIQVLELRDLVSELGRDHTVLFSTHILSEAEQVCDKVIIINRGEIIGQGSPAELRQELERGQRVLVRIDSDTSEALDILNGLDDLVASVTLERDAIIIEPAIDDDIRAGIAHVLVEKGVKLIEIRPAANSLEDIFLELTRRNVTDSPEPSQVADALAAQSAVPDGVLAPETGAETPNNEEADV